MSDLLRTLAAVYRRRGLTEIAAADLKHALSLDLRWFAPADAKRLTQHAVDVGLLEADGDVLRATFDVAAVDVPVTFRPTLAVLDEAAPAAPPVRKAPAAAATAAAPATPAHAAAARPAEQALREAAHLAGEDLDVLTREAAQEREKRGRLLTADVAALVVARRHGVDVRAHAARIRTEARPE